MPEQQVKFARHETMTPTRRKRHIENSFIQRDALGRTDPPFVDEGCCKPFAWSANSVHRQAVQPAAPLRRRAHGWRPVVLTSAKAKATSRRWWSPVTVETFELRDERHIAVIGTSYRLRISYSLPQNLTHTQVGARRRSRASRRPEQVPSSNVPITVTLANPV